MQLALCGVTALRVLRAARQGLVGQQGVPRKRTSLLAPDPGQGRKRFTAGILADLSISQWAIPSDCPLDVAVPDQRQRIQVKGVSCKVFSQSALQQSFISLGEGMQVSSPELLFVEMSQEMPLINLVLLGCELCGSFGRDPLNPHDGDVVYWIDPITSTEKLRSFVGSCKNVRGLTRAKEALRFMMDNAWSPMEALVAVMAALPVSHGGYGFSPVILNERVPVSEAASRESRIPDMLFADGKTGLNYDGEDHLDLEKVVVAAQRINNNAAEKASEQQLSSALEDVRSKYVDDRRRDRELIASGHLVFSITKEDLAEKGGLDRVMSLVLDAMERDGGMDLGIQRAAMRVRELVRMRQDLLWSAMPGALGVKARQRIARRKAHRRRELEALNASLRDPNAWETVMF